jgi:hypothetical protein
MTYYLKDSLIKWFSCDEILFNFKGTENNANKST